MVSVEYNYTDFCRNIHAVHPCSASFSTTSYSHASAYVLNVTRQEGTTPAHPHECTTLG